VCSSRGFSHPAIYSPRIFQNNLEPVAAIQGIKSQRPQDIWMNIYQNKERLVLFTGLLPIWKINPTLMKLFFMQINTMGVTQALNILTEGDFEPRYDSFSFNFDLNSNLFRFNAHGHVVKTN